MAETVAIVDYGAGNLRSVANAMLRVAGEMADPPRVLVTAEAGSQSGKARKAAEYGKPVYTAEEFFAWLASR